MSESDAIDPPGPEAVFADRLLEVETLLNSSEVDAPDQARVAIDELEQELGQSPLAGSDHAKGLRAAVFTAKGHLDRLENRPDLAIEAYDEAIAALNEAGPGTVRDRQFANLWTCRGLALLTQGDAGSLKQAVDSFDRAIAIRESGEVNRSERWGIAAARLNRADALAGLGGVEHLLESRQSAEQAMQDLDDFDPAENVAVRTRHALAWMKHGESSARLWHEFRQGKPGDAYTSLETAIALLRAGFADGLEESRRLLAVALNNLSRTRLLLDGRGSEAGLGEAEDALTLIQNFELDSPETVSLGGGARINCACHLESLDDGAERAMEITDLAEDGLTLVGKARQLFGPEMIDGALVGELLRLGAQAYLRSAPQYLSDFLLEQLDPDRNESHFADIAEAHEVAVRTLWNGIAEIQRGGFSGIGTEAYEERRARLTEWEECRERLHAIRRVYFEI